MPDVVERMRPHGLISLLPAANQPPTPLEIRKGGHLRILVDDIDEPQPGYTAPARAHVAELVGFLRATPPRASLVIHCLAGVSRSTAAALIALALDAPGREAEAARVLREASPFASPNRLLVSLADRELGRKGALVAALDAMGEPDWSRDFEAFLLPRQLPPA
jgi:predicted protein tyrosine phosphatase